MGSACSLFSINVLRRDSDRNSVARYCLEKQGVYRACNCAQVKSTCIGNPSFKLTFIRQSWVPKLVFRYRMLLGIIWHSLNLFLNMGFRIPEKMSIFYSRKFYVLKTLCFTMTVNLNQNN